MSGIENNKINVVADFVDDLRYTFSEVKFMFTA